MLTMIPGVAQTLEEQKVTTNMTLKITLQNKNLQNCTPKKRNSRIILGKKGLLPKNLFPWKNYKSTEQRLVAEIPKFESCAGKNLPGSVSLGFFQSYKLTWLAIENHPFFKSERHPVGPYNCPLKEISHFQMVYFVPCSFWFMGMHTFVPKSKR